MVLVKLDEVLAFEEVFQIAQWPTAEELGRERGSADGLAEEPAHLHGADHGRGGKDEAGNDVL